MSTLTHPERQWHWISECDVPVTTAEESSVVANDSPDPTYQDCWPSARYLSDGPDDNTPESAWAHMASQVGATVKEPLTVDQCSECRCAPGQPHAPGCESTAPLTESVINAVPEHVESYVPEGSREHRIGTCYEDPDTGEYVMPGDFCGEKELRWKHNLEHGDALSTVSARRWDQQCSASPALTTYPGSTAEGCTADKVCGVHVKSCGSCDDTACASILPEGEMRNAAPPCAYYHESPDVTAESCPECGTVTDIEYGALMAEGYRDPEVCPKRETVPEEETPDIPFPVQIWLFESLCEVGIAKLHDLIDDHRDLIIELARARFRDGYKMHGSKMYAWTPERRLDETLCEVADAVVYPTSGPLE